jgi:tetratricopeptide (TPR) repeat protein
LKGLYQRALEFYRQSPPPRLVHRQEARQQALPEEEGITAEEKQLMQEEIEALLSKSRIQVSAETLAYTPKRRGTLLPLASNLIILLLVAGAIGLASLLLNRQEASIAGRSAVILSAESELIAALKQESEQQLLQKDRSILEIQERLGAISLEREQLRSSMEAALTAQEQKLAGDFERRLAEERERLAQQGLSDSAIERRLQELEASLRRSYEEQLATARSKAEAELASKEATAKSLAGQYERELTQAQTERSQMQAELKRKEAELQQQFQQQQTQLESDRAHVAEELARLRQQQEQERLVLDQILSGYERVNRALQGARYEEALSDLQALRGFFDERGVAELPAVQKRRGLELFLIASLEELIRSRQARVQSDTPALLEASALLASVTDRVERGDALSRSGDLAAAREAYLDALSRIPAVDRGFARLEEMRQAREAQAKAAARRELESALGQGNVFYQAGNFQDSLERYKRALTLLLEDEQLSGRVTEHIMNAGFRLLAATELRELAGLKTAEARRAELLARLRELKEQYQAYVQLKPSSSLDEDTPEAISTLLQAKILVRQILDSEPIRSQYPDLAATMERYFTALGNQREREGRQAVLDELETLFSRLLARQKLATPPELTSYRRDGESDPFLALLDRLQALIR